eukprot:COSAG01_NODE_55329_length_326_cov_0.458150_1_plen_50_part_01
MRRPGTRLLLPLDRATPSRARAQTLRVTMARPKSAEPDVITRGLALAAAH